MLSFAVSLNSKIRSPGSWSGLFSAAPDCTVTYLRVAPAGTLTLKSLFFFITLCPWHVLHAFFTTSPFPPQCPHTCWICCVMNPIWIIWIVTPRPWQCGHLVTLPSCEPLPWQ